MAFILKTFNLAFVETWLPFVARRGAEVRPVDAGLEFDGIDFKGASTVRLRAEGHMIRPFILASKFVSLPVGAGL